MVAALALLVLAALAAGAQSTTTGTGRQTTIDVTIVVRNATNAQVTVQGKTAAAPYTVQLAPGTYAIAIQAPGYQPLNPNITVTATTDKKMTFNFDLVPLLFRLTVNANVKEATVMVNNVAKGTAGWSADLAPGTYVVLVSANGYDSYTETVNLARATTITANLKQARFRLTVNANVKEATVTVNNVVKGTAGYAEELPAGAYTVLVAAKGYDPYTETVNLARATTVTANLKQSTFRLTVNANVKEATVSVNNAVKGTAGWSDDLAPGNYVVLVAAAGYEPFTQAVTLDRPTTVTANLKAAVATLLLPSQYLEGDVQFVKVYLDGKLMSAQIAAKGTIQVPAGKHKVRIASAPVGLATEAEFEFVGGQTYEMRLQLQFVVPPKQ